VCVREGERDRVREKGREGNTHTHEQIALAFRVVQTCPRRQPPFRHLPVCACACVYVCVCVCVCVRAHFVCV